MGLLSDVTVILLLGIGLLFFFKSQLPETGAQDIPSEGGEGTGDYIILRNGWAYNPDEWPDWLDPPAVGSILDALTMLAQALTSKIGDKFADTDSKARGDVDEDTKKAVEKKVLDADEKARADADSKARGADTGGLDSDTKTAIENKVADAEERVRAEADEKARGGDTGGLDEDTKTAVENKVAEAEERVRADADEKARGGDTGGLDEDTKTAIENRVAEAEERVRADADEKARGGDTGGLDEDTKTAIENRVAEAEERVRADADEKARGGDTGGLDEDTKTAIENRVAEAEEKVRVNAETAASGKDTGGLDEDTKTAIENRVAEAEERVRADADEKARGGDTGGLDEDTKTAIENRVAEAEERVRAEADSKAQGQDTGGLDEDTKTAIENRVAEAEERVRVNAETAAAGKDTGGLDEDTKTAIENRVAEAEERVRAEADSKAQGQDTGGLDEDTKTAIENRVADAEEKVRVNAETAAAGKDTGGLDEDTKTAIENRVAEAEERVRVNADTAAAGRDTGGLDEDTKTAIENRVAEAEEKVRVNAETAASGRDTGGLDEDTKTVIENRVAEAEEKVRVNAETAAAGRDTGGLDEDTKTVIENRVAEAEEKVRVNAETAAAGKDTGGLDTDTKTAIEKKVIDAEEKVRVKAETAASGKDTGGLDEDTKTAIENRVAEAEDRVRAEADSKARGGDTGGLETDTKTAIEKKVIDAEEKVRVNAETAAAGKDAGGLDADTKTVIEKKVIDAEEKVRVNAETAAASKDTGGLDTDTKTAITKKVIDAEEKVRVKAEMAAAGKDAGGLDADTKTVIEKKVIDAEEKVRVNAETAAETKDTGGLDADTKTAITKKVIDAEEKVRVNAETAAAGRDTGGLDTDTKTAITKKVVDAEEKVRSNADTTARIGDMAGLENDTKTEIEKKVIDAEEKVRNKTNVDAEFRVGGLDGDTKSAITKKVIEAEEKVRVNAETAAETKDTGGLEGDTKSAITKKVNDAEEKVRSNADTKASGGDMTGLDGDTKTAITKKVIEAEEKVRVNAETAAETKDTGGLEGDTKTAMTKKMNDAEEKVRSNADTYARGQDMTGLDGDTKSAITKKVTDAEEKVRSTAETTAEKKDTGGLEGDTKTALSKKVADIEEKVRKTYVATRSKSAMTFETRISVSSARVVEIVEKRIDRGVDGKVKDPGSTKYFSYDGKVYSAFGHVPTPKMAKRIAKGFSSYAARQLSTARKSINQGVKMIGESAGGKVIDNGSKMAGNTLQFIAGDGLDVLGIFQVITDGFFNFPDESEFINKYIVYKVKRQSVRLQLDTMQKYNKDIDSKNNSRQLGTTALPYTKYPHITGPLDKLDTDPIVSETRAQFEVDTIRHKRLTTPNTIHSQLLIQRIGQPVYDTLKTVTEFNKKTLLSYVDGQTLRDEYGDVTDTIDGVFSADESDNLYREAFTAVCNYNGGVVYEDRQPVQSDSIDPGTPTLSWRPRFQCGWSTEAECQREANSWYNTYKNGQQSYGDYAEWFSFDDVALRNISTGSSVSSNYQNATHAVYLSTDTAFSDRECPAWFDITRRYVYMAVDATNVMQITSVDSVYVYGYFVTGTAPASITTIKLGYTKSVSGITDTVPAGAYMVRQLAIAPKETGQTCLPGVGQLGNELDCSGSSGCAPGYKLQKSESCFTKAYAEAAALGAAVGVGLGASGRGRSVMISAGVSAIVAGATVPAFRLTVRNVCRCVIDTDRANAPSEIDYPLLVPRGSKLRANGKSGACIVTNPGFRSMCAYGKGTYDQTVENRCTYTTEFCQNMGMCFDESSMTCYLPGAEMFAATFLFGTGGPREWIKIHGCKSSGGDKGLNALSVADGRRMLSDALANSKRWPSNVKKAMQDPAYALMNLSSLGVLGRFTSFPGAMSSLSMYLAVGGLVVMAGQYGARKVGDRLSNTTDPKEYAVGGFIEPPEGTTEDPIPISPTYVDGWLTKPLDFVPSAPTVQFAHITDYPDFPLGFKNSPANYLTTRPEQQFCTSTYAVEITAVVGFNQDNARQNACWKYRPYVEVTPAQTFNFRFYERVESGRKEVYMYMAWSYQTLFNTYGTSTPFYLARNSIDGRGDRKYKFQFTGDTRNPENNSPDTGSNGGDIAARKLIITRIDGNDTRQTQVWADDLRTADRWKIDYNTCGLFGCTYRDEGQMFYVNGYVNGVWGNYPAPFRLLQQSEDRMIRAGIKTKYNALWCIPSKPTASYYVDPEIGTLAPEELYMQNRSWTDGLDPQSPAYPEQGIVDDLGTTEDGGGTFFNGSCRFTGDSPKNQKFFYQLVYDKDNMAVATTTLTAQVNGNMTASQLTITVANTSGFSAGSILSSDSTSALGLIGTATVLRVVSATQITLSFTEQPLTSVPVTPTVTIKLSMPKNLWETDVLSKYFSNSTITDMRRYYCQEAFAADMTGETVEKKCFGYISTRTVNYVMLPMTVLSSKATKITS